MAVVVVVFGLLGLLVGNAALVISVAVMLLVLFMRVVRCKFITGMLVLYKTRYLLLDPND